MQENYGCNEPTKVLKVKQLYKTLELQTLYKDCEESSYKDIIADINSFTGDIPKEIFTDFVKKIYKRDK